MKFINQNTSHTMRTYNITFSESNTGNKFNFKTDKDGFRRMRHFILAACNGVEMPFLDRLVNICDDIRDMEIGETMFVISSAFEPYVEKTIDKFNKTVAMMDNAARRDLGEKYICDAHTAFMVKRTNAMWKFATLDYEIQ